MSYLNYLSFSCLSKKGDDTSTGFCGYTVVHPFDFPLPLLKAHALLLLDTGSLLLTYVTLLD